MIRIILLALVISGCSTIETFNPTNKKGTIKYEILGFDAIQEICNPKKTVSVTNGCAFPQSWG